MDFSGGCAEHYDLKEENPDEIYNLMMKGRFPIIYLNWNKITNSH